jgi:hypothetical protein
MRLTHTILALAACALAAPAAPDEKKDDRKEDKDKAGSNGRPFEVRFADGSSLRMTLPEETFEVATRYGKLRVPTSEIRSIDFGRRIPAAVAKEIDDAAAKLGSDDFKDREAASAALLEVGEMAYPRVLELTRSTDREVAKRAQDIAKALREKYPEEKLNFKLDDHVVADKLTFSGRLESPAIKARSVYFGEVTIKLADLRSIRALGAAATGAENELALDAAKYASPRLVWMETAIEVREDDQLTITASGEINMWPVGGDTSYKSTPAGQPGWGVAKGETFAAGRVLGRVGESGKVFDVGDKYEGSPRQAGKLYLRISASPWNNESIGEYKVKVVVK